jgi:RNA polymerase sigma factor (sigma-70 family)
MADDEITHWLSGLAQGNETAVQEIWQRYCERLVRFARQKLGDSGRRVADEEDVALSAFHSFCRGVAAGHFPRLDDRHDLCKLLLTITARKVAAQMRYSHRQKRGGGNVRGESVFLHGDDSQAVVGIEQVMGEEPTPELAAMLSEECQRLLDRLGDDTLRQIALLKLEGYSNEEIARELNCAPRTVERKLARIRETWGQETPA